MAVMAVHFARTKSECQGTGATGRKGLSISYGPGLVAPGGGPPPHAREDGSFYLKQSSAPSLPTAPMYQVMWTD